MKITTTTTTTTDRSTLIQSPDLPPPHKPRKTPLRFKTKRISRPQTPLPKSNPPHLNNSAVLEDQLTVPPQISARKLAAGLWKLHSPPFEHGGGDGWASIHGHCVNRLDTSGDLVQSLHSESCKRNGSSYKLDPLLQFPDSAMEGATKWDPSGGRARDEWNKMLNQPKFPHKGASTTPVISALKTELEQAKAKIDELESERKSSKKKLEQFLRKLSEERALWRSREHEKIRAVIDDMKLDLNREKKNRQRLEIVNSKLVNELAEVKLSAKRYVHEYGKEKKARELIEEVCDELAKEIGEDRTEAEALKRESMKLQEEVEEERKMLQMAEVWREERVQMKLVDAKVMLEEKFSHMNRLLVDIESFLNSNGRSSDLEQIKKAEFLRQMVTSIDMQDVRELTYEPPNSDDIFSIFEDMNFGGSNEKEAEPCSEYSPVSHDSKNQTMSPGTKLRNRNSALTRSDVYRDESGDLEEDASEWETVSNLDERGSTFSPDGSDNPSIKQNYRASSVSRSGTEWERSGEETPVREISEVGSRKAMQSKKVSAISRLWKSSNGDNYKIMSIGGIKGRISNRRLSNGRLSNGIAMSDDCGSEQGGPYPNDLSGQWSSPDSIDPQLYEVMKGRASANQSSLKSRLLEARMENQKTQLRQVLKQKI